MKQKEKVTAIVLAGGSGLRLERELPKQFLQIMDRPLIAWTLDSFQAHDDVDSIIVAVPAVYIDLMKGIIEQYGFSKTERIVPGGATRQGSSYCAMTSREFNGDDILIFHDAARPFAGAGVISQCIERTGITGAAGVYVPATDTVAEIDSGIVAAILRREKLHYTQTPQCFKYRIIRDAHEKARDKGVNDATDDVSLAVDAGYPVEMVTGEYSNIKITTSHDLALAEYLIALLRK